MSEKKTDSRKQEKLPVVEGAKGAPLCYGKEPFDLRLTVLRMLYRLPVIAAVTVLGALVFGGGYYVRNVLFCSEHLYAATSVYRVEYHVDSEEELQTSYINAMSWNTYMQSQMFLEMLQSHMAGGAELSQQELEESLEAFVWSDLRMPAVTVTTDNPERTEEILRAVDEVMTQDFSLREIDSISVIDPGRAEEVIPDIRVGRAVILSALLSCFFAVICLLLKETGDDAIWLPGTIWKRYGLKVAGTPESRELAQNMRYFFGGRGDERQESLKSMAQHNTERKNEKNEADNREKRNQGGTGQEPAIKNGNGSGRHGIAVCMVQEELQPETVLAGLREKCPETVDSSWFAVESPLKEPGSCGALRGAEGILLAVKAGSHAGKKLEYVLEYLQQQDCEVTAVILWEADEKLIRRYYFGKRKNSGSGLSGTGSMNV
ncbi:MAG TPA: hypothetical protein DCZ91_08325 [Lachnospiraceae bacterium]|nr:hypothetical protein [Lachnospiraceae bacterium]